MKSFTIAILIGWEILVNYFGYFILQTLYSSILKSAPSCGYYLIVTLFLVAFSCSVLYCFIAKKYKLRVRQEIYHSHYVVEEIFENEFDLRDQEEADYPEIYNTHSSDDEEQHSMYQN